MANVAMVSATLHQLKDPTVTPFVVTDCKWVFLGPASEYAYSFADRVVSPKVPQRMDFNVGKGVGAVCIAGWSCCCFDESMGWAPSEWFGAIFDRKKVEEAR